VTRVTNTDHLALSRCRPSSANFTRRAPTTRTTSGPRTAGASAASRTLERPPPRDAETADDKAHRYLGDCRLPIRQFSRAGVVAFVVGDSGLTYRPEWSPDIGWTCNCPSREQLCAHVIALRLVTVAHATQDQETTDHV
jgi:hypothetical protein